MNNKERQFLEVPLGIEAHHIAGKLAAEQTTTEKSKQVYLNTLAVYAVHRYLKWLGIETSLTKSDSWNPILRNKWNVADLEIPGSGKLECRPFLPGETTIFLPAEVTEDRIGYLGVQFSDRLDKVQILGFTKTANGGVLEIRQLQSTDELINELSPVNLGKWFEGIFDEVWQPIKFLFKVKNLEPLRLKNRPKEDLNPDKNDANKGENKVIERGQTIGFLANSQQLNLVVGIRKEENQELGCLFQVFPMNVGEYLPVGLKLKVILESEEAEKKVESTEQKEPLKIRLTELPGKLITVQVHLENEFITRTFIL
ncbi:DUF1822 family protein [Aphanothece sacrum]|uniref:DUF1822 family protein n=1 Tax=Aphanothece sacrum FPU1 TaxID=1920663 RepID=A0A401ID65_APHSA|nr:DUF1822 family protein [Aphanothece sacrum]GBF79176.1 hypothetical protein AsFPU1_0568 [Aphanothece sacrum FPU1]GBF86565.1 hypothetical protein AsFPU3_3636 [Aphanothece sacrum FPU3]